MEATNRWWEDAQAEIPRHATKIDCDTDKNKILKLKSGNELNVNVIDSKNKRFEVKIFIKTIEFIGEFYSIEGFTINKYPINLELSFSDPNASLIWWHGQKPRELKTDEEEFIDNPVAREMYRAKLELIQNCSVNFPNSNGPENIDLPKNRTEFNASQNRFENELSPYQTKFSTPEQSQIFWRGNENIGHKLHLNVALNNVKKVSEYLIKNRILHK